MCSVVWQWDVCWWSLPVLGRFRGRALHDGGASTKHEHGCRRRCERHVVLVDAVDVRGLDVLVVSVGVELGFTIPSTWSCS